MLESTTETLRAQTYYFAVQDLSISFEEVNARVRMDGNLSFFKAFLTKELIKLEKIESIQGGVVIVDKLTIGSDTIHLYDKQFKVGKQIAHYLKDSSKVALFLCTAGKEVSLRSKELMDNGKLVEGYLLDCLGSIMVEKAMDTIQQKISENLKQQHLNTTNRYSPGYCEWSVSDQQTLFSFFPDKFCNVTLSENSLMHPVKSVSGIIGVGKDARYQNYNCETCNNKNCVYRNLKK